MGGEEDRGGGVDDGRGCQEEDEDEGRAALTEVASKLEALGVGAEAHLEGPVGNGLNLGVGGVVLLRRVPAVAAVGVRDGHIALASS